ncbi:hypothetical protein Ptr902_10619 [Pyrenophora tritici-repentis]|nr:hypothetical protein Ptr902_10619 [Pyrenophora tritici-repentis]
MSNIDGFPGDFPGGTQDTNTIAGDTQGYLASPSRPRRRESSFFVSHPRTQQPPTGPDSGHQEPTTPDKYIFVEFTDVIGKQAANRPKDWHYFVTSLLTVIRNAALATELKDVRIAELTELLDNSQQLEAGHVSSKDFNVKCKELAADPAYKALLTERNALTVERDDFKVRHEDCVDRGSFNSLRDKYDREKKDADLYYHKYNNAANAHDRDRSQ